MEVLAVIPARYDSRRYPGKVLEPLGPHPLIRWVYEAAADCEVLGAVIVATDDERVASCVGEFGGRVEMTRSDHASGTDRVAEVAARHPEAEVVVNIQADQPFVTARMVASLVEPYVAGDRPPMTTLACPMAPELLEDPGAVKVVCDRTGRALYFSRAPIPFDWRADGAPSLHHLGLYAFSREFLCTYAALAAGPLELREGLEQLRALEHGHPVTVCFTDEMVLEVNTPHDMRLARARLARA